MVLVTTLKSKGDGSLDVHLLGSCFIRCWNVHTLYQCAHGSGAAFRLVYFGRRACGPDLTATVLLCLWINSKQPAVVTNSGGVFL